MTKKHHAKRICAGEYEYRGHSISCVPTEFGCRGGSEDMWFISKLEGHPGYFDPVHTKRYAMECIDHALDEGN